LWAAFGSRLSALGPEVRVAAESRELTAESRNPPRHAEGTHADSSHQAGGDVDARAMSRSRKRFGWGTPSVLTARAAAPDGARTAVSGAELTVLFDHLGVDAQGSDSPLADVSIASVLVPLAVPRGTRRLRLTARLRGAVVKTAGSRVVIALSTDGRCETIEVPTGQAAEKTLYRKIVIECAVPSDGLCAATVWLQGVRATHADAVVASIDSLDVVLSSLQSPNTASY
jgi:hypothetical protein